MVYIVIAWVVLAFIVSVIASSVGRNFFGYFILSIITSPILALIILCIFGRSDKEQALRELRIAAEIEEIKKRQENVEVEASKADTTEEDWQSTLVLIGAILLVFVLMCLGCYLML